ncbi:hypothetical protein B0H19DRAFT_1086228 [Mycena capillaripes]|nr:hypothetical protein B0H19DRAFT_1086228 [Mycena capillaripes]
MAQCSAIPRIRGEDENCGRGSPRRSAARFDKLMYKHQSCGGCRFKSGWGSASQWGIYWRRLPLCVAALWRSGTEKLLNELWAARQRDVGVEMRRDFFHKSLKDWVESIGKGRGEKGIGRVTRSTGVEGLTPIAPYIQTKNFGVRIFIFKGITMK